MARETKRSVSNEAMELILDAYGDTDYANEFISRYDDALSVELPIIPKPVGQLIKNWKEYHKSLLDVSSVLSNFGVLRVQSGSENIDWINNNYETFAMAWVLNEWKEFDEDSCDLRISSVQ